MFYDDAREYHFVHYIAFCTCTSTSVVDIQTSVFHKVAIPSNNIPCTVFCAKIGVF